MTNPQLWLDEHGERVERDFAALLLGTSDEDLPHLLMLLCNLSISLLCRYYVRVAYSAAVNGHDTQSVITALHQTLERLGTAHFDAALTDLDDAVFKNIQPITRTVQ